MTLRKRLLILLAFNAIALVVIFAPSWLGVTSEEVDAKINAAIGRVKDAMLR